MPLVRELKPGESLRIGDTVIVVEPKTGQRTRLRIDTSLPIQHLKAGQAPAPASTTPTADTAAEPATPRATLFKPALQTG